MTDTAKRAGPLAGIRVVELGQLLAGPFCGQLLGDLGAEVIKIEPPGQGDPLRQWGQVRPDGISVWFAIVGRNKTYATLDLRQEEGRALLRRLLATTDILIENFRPGTLEKWGLGWEALSQINPRLIVARISGYGQTGPYAAKAGYASVGEAFSGFRYPIGEPDRLPSRTGTSIGDSLAATFAALGAVSALQARERTGRGQVVDTAIYEACLAMMESLIPDFQFGGLIRERTGSFLPRIAPSNIYPTNDGMVIIGANQDSVFTRLAEAMGQPALGADPRYSSHVARGERQGELDALVSAWTSAHPSAEIQRLCDIHGVPCGPVNRASDLLTEPHIAARAAIVSALHPQLGEIKMQGAFPKFSDTPGGVRWPARDMGADNDYVWRDLVGLAAEELAGIKNRRII
jgi:formyl-CoA transferase